MSLTVCPFHFKDGLGRLFSIGGDERQMGKTSKLAVTSACVAVEAVAGHYLYRFILHSRVDRCMYEKKISLLFVMGQCGKDAL